MKRMMALLLFCVTACWAQMTPQQRVDDFNYLTGLLNRNYAPYEWKRQVFGFDMLDTTTWVERARNAKDDTEFYNICVEYIGNLNDSNTYLVLPSDFEAYLGFTADLYDGKAIIEFIDRSQLPTSRFSIAIGDEVVSIDGRTLENLLPEYAKYVIESGEKATRRFAIDGITYRVQAFNPQSADVGATSRVVIRKADGSMVNLDLPWVKLGTPMRVGPVPDFTGIERDSKPFHEQFLESLDRLPPDRRKARRMAAADNAAADNEDQDPVEVQATGTLVPIYSLPGDFQLRVGRNRTDSIYSGSYASGGKRIGYLRIPAFSTSAAFLTQLDTEIAWLEANTDVLVLDQMSDRLVTLCGAERVAARFIGKTFLQPGFEYRASWTNVLSFELALESALDAGADNTTIAWIRAILNNLRTAYSENRGRTGPLPLCGPTMDRPPVTDRDGRIVTYTKPILLVTDEFSSDYFAAAVKDAGRAKQFGIRTRGHLGTSISVPGSAFSELTVRIKDSMMVRAAAVTSPGYPDSVYIENTGVHPEFVEDYMTMENYRLRGTPFVQAFTRAALSLLSQ